MSLEVMSMPRTLNELREGAYLTTRELAKRARVAPATLWRIEQAKTKPHITTMRKIADVLGVHPSEVAEFTLESAEQ